MSQREHRRHVAAGHQHLGRHLIEAWVGVWWPWIGLAAGIVIVIVGGIFFTPSAGP